MYIHKHVQVCVFGLWWDGSLSWHVAATCQGAGLRQGVRAQDTAILVLLLGTFSHQFAASDLAGVSVRVVRPACKHTWWLR